MSRESATSGCKTVIRVSWIVMALVTSAACNRPSGGGAAAERRSALGVSPGTWPEQGPNPILSNVHQLDPFNDAMTGAVHRLALDFNDTTTLYAAAVNGGVWKTTASTSVFAPTPTPVQWTTNTDLLPSLSTSVVAIDPLASSHLVAVTGARSNGPPPGAEGLVYVSHNGGDSWTTIDTPLLRGQTIIGLAVRGDLILVGGINPQDSRKGFLIRSGNGGTDWTSAGGGGDLPATFGPALDLVRDPSDSDRYYVLISDRGSGGSGVYLGTNGGTTWTRVVGTDTSRGSLPDLLQNADVNTGRLAIGPTGTLFVTFAATGQPIYVGFTPDHGTNWTRMDLPAVPATFGPQSPQPIAEIKRGGIPGASAQSILVDAGTEHHLDGSSPVRILGLPSIPNVQDLNGDWNAKPYNEPQADGGTTPSPTKFLLVSRLKDQQGDGMSVAFDVTATGTWQFWLGTNPFNQADKNLALAVDPTDPKFVYYGGDAGSNRLLRGDTSKPTSTAIPSGQWTSLIDGSQREIHTDMRDLVLDPSGQLLYACSDGGVFVRKSPRDSSGQWVSMAGNLVSAEFTTIAVDPLSHGILGGTQDNGTPSQDLTSSGSLLWPQLEYSDGVGVAAVDAHDVDPTSGAPISYRYTSFIGSNDLEVHTFNDVGAYLGTTFLISPNNNQSSKLIVTPPGKPLNEVDDIGAPPALGVNRVFNQQTQLLPEPPQKWLLIPGHNQGVWESRDRGETAKLVAGSPLNARAFSYGNVNNVAALWVAAENSGVITIHSRLVDGQAMNLEATFSGGVTAVAMSASDPTLVYATVDSRVFRLTHGNPTPAPVEVTGDLASVIMGPWQGVGRLRGIAYVPSAAHGDRIFVSAAEGGAPGVFMMAIDNPGVWTRIGTNLPNADAFALDYDAGADTLVVGTAGRGAWSLVGASTLDRAPKALCRSRTLSADASCRVTVSPSAFDNGSLDPDGNPLTFTALDPSKLTPIVLPSFTLGTFPLTIEVSDDQGAGALCTPAVSLTVVDTTPPVLQVPAARNLTTCADSQVVSIGQATATDNCATGLVPTGQVVSKNGVPLNPPIAVVNGQATLGPGTYVVRWTVSDRVNPPTQLDQTVTVGAAIEVSQTFLLDDRAQLQNASGGFAALLNSGTGTTRVGQDGRTGGVISRAPVTVQHRAIVGGNIVSGSTVTVDSDATVNGTITRNATVSLPALPALPTFPPATLAAFTVNAGTTQSHGPGSYAGGTILNGGTLNMQAGDYFFQSLTINSGAILRVPAGTRVFVRDSLIFNSSFRAPTGSALQTVFLGFAGANLSMYAPFNGTLLAPNASVTFGTGAGLSFRGQFFGRSFEVTPASALVCAP